jgi:hypothetical protein
MPKCVLDEIDFFAAFRSERWTLEVLLILKTRRATLWRFFCYFLGTTATSISRKCAG